MPGRKLCRKARKAVVPTWLAHSRHPEVWWPYGQNAKVYCPTPSQPGTQCFPWHGDWKPGRSSRCFLYMACIFARHEHSGTMQNLDGASTSPQFILFPCPSPAVWNPNITSLFATIKWGMINSICCASYSRRPESECTIHCAFLRQVFFCGGRMEKYRPCYSHDILTAAFFSPPDRSLRCARSSHASKRHRDMHLPSTLAFPSFTPPLSLSSCRKHPPPPGTVCAWVLGRKSPKCHQPRPRI
jgi:hypothetical protein